MSNGTRLVKSLTLAFVLGFAAAARGQTTGLFIDSQPGDVVGQGRQHTIRADAEVTATANFQNGVGLTFSGPLFSYRWNLQFAAGDRARLRVGTYADASPFQEQRYNGMGVSNVPSGGWCLETRGRFVVREIEYGSDGMLLRFAADFEQRCGDAVAALFGAVRFNSTISDLTPFGGEYPVYRLTVAATAGGRVGGGALDCGGLSTQCVQTLVAPEAIMLSAIPDPGYTFRAWTGSCSGAAAAVSVRVISDLQCGAVFASAASTAPSTALVLNSDAGDPLGGGVPRLYSADNAAWTIQVATGPYTGMLDNGVAARVQGFNGTRWLIALRAPDGSVIAPGEYISATSASDDAVLPLLVVTNDAGQTCPSNGRFIVYELERAGQTVTRLAADFEVHCDNATPTLVGAIRFNSTRRATPFDGDAVQYRLIVPPSPYGAVTGGALACGNGATHCEQTFETATAVTLAATAATGARFLGWAGDCAGASTTTTLMVNTIRRCTAVFQPEAPSEPRTVLMVDRLSGAPSNLGPLFFTPETTLWTVGRTSRGFTFTARRDATAATSATVTMEAPEGQFLQPGAYWNTRANLWGTGTPNLIVSAGQSGCFGSGRFVVYNLEWNADDSLARFAADFEMRCHPSEPGMYGAIRYNSAMSGIAPFGGQYPRFVLEIVPALHGRVLGPGIDCGGGGTACRAEYADVTQVPLRAMPDGGYLVTGWTLDCFGGAQISLWVAGTKRCQALFETPATTTPRTQVVLDSPSSTAAKNLATLYPGTAMRFHHSMPEAFDRYVVRISVTGADDSSAGLNFFTPYNLPFRDWATTPPFTVVPYDYRGSEAMVETSGVASVCDRVIGGTFTIRELETIPGTFTLVRFAIDFDLLCSSPTNPELRGSVRFNSTVPLRTSAGTLGLVPSAPAPQLPGTAITFTATLSGVPGPVQYKWFLYDGTTWFAQGPWSSSFTFTWSASEVNANMRVGVWARSAQWQRDSAEFSASQAFPILRPGVSLLLLGTGTGQTQPLGASNLLTATAVGGVSPHQFKWLVFDGSAWTMVQDWAISNTLTFTPVIAGTHTVRVLVRSAANPSDVPEASAEATFFILRSRVTGVTLSASASAPRPPGSTIVFSANAVGGTAPVQYRWWVFSPTTGWTIAANWNVTNTFAWTPLAEDEGYRVGVWVRGAGTSAAAGADVTAAMPFAIRRPRVTAVTFTADRSPPQLPGTSVTFEASATGGEGPPQFKWFVFDGQTWIVVRDWNPSSTFVWTPVVVNPNYRVGVWARSADSSADRADAGAATPFPVTNVRVTSVSVQSSVAAPQAPGTTITFTAAAVGGTAPIQYRWWVYRPSTGWAVAADWSTAAIFTWTPELEDAEYRVGVWARAAGAPPNASPDATESVAFPIQRARVTAVTLSSDREAPQATGTSILFTANANGGAAPHQYKWWVFDGTTWTAIRNWSTEATLTWTPATANANYRVGVWARSHGSMIDAADAGVSVPFPITNVRVTSVSVRSDAPSPQQPGTPITFTATAVGGTTPTQYRWWVYRPSAGWTVAADWSTAATFTWTPALEDAEYRVGVWSRAAGAPADAPPDATDSIAFPIERAPVTVVTLALAPRLGQQAAGRFILISRKANDGRDTAPNRR